VIENQWVIESARAHAIPVIHYEMLRSTDEDAWPALCAALGVAHRPERTILTRPSQQSGADRTAIPLSQSARPRWMNGLSQSDSREIQGILDAVGIREYAMDEPNPISAGAMVACAGQAGAGP
jgi:hypothetical protein